ncbi:hypothetical protein [Arcobacter porcinus]|uniref:hypothetical protein n=1 Tax=Arcobacter porcinus TaxID=1935204 RepID=UPI0008251C3F|nr:hypothetical protein [Arcobacter porcinus]OCL86163.1 hypothetical protein AAX30_01504 [Arcobacter porcinus]
MNKDKDEKIEFDIRYVKYSDMRELIDASQEYREYMESDEAKELQRKIDAELTYLEKFVKALEIVSKEIKEDRKKFTIKSNNQDIRLEDKSSSITTIDNDINSSLDELENNLKLLQVNLKNIDDR